MHHIYKFSTNCVKCQNDVNVKFKSLIQTLIANHMVLTQLILFFSFYFTAIQFDILITILTTSVSFPIILTFCDIHSQRIKFSRHVFRDHFFFLLT